MGTMTEAAYFGKIRSALRKAFSWWQPMQAAVNAHRRNSQSDNKRLKFEYQCSSCQGWFPRKQVEIDHVIPCGTLRSLEDIAVFVSNLTQEDPAMYQLLCTGGPCSCHQLKTNADRVQKKSNHENQTQANSNMGHPLG